MAKDKEKKNKGGRPKEDIAVKYNIDFKRLEKIAVYGITDAQIAELYGVSPATICDWKERDERFSEAIKKGKAKADSAVVKSLYRRALGYAHNETTHERMKVGGKETQAVKTKIVRKQVHPDVTAQIFWLKNRRPDEWRDVKDHNLRGSVGLSYKDGLKKVGEAIESNEDLKEKLEDELAD